MGKREKNNIWIQLDSYDTYIFGDTLTFAHLKYILNKKENLKHKFVDRKNKKVDRKCLDIRIFL